MKSEWLLKRNCSLSPRQTGWAYGVLCAGLLAVGVGFTIRGAWLVFAFAMAEITSLALALRHYARHASDRERVALSEHCLLVERIDGGQVRQVRLDPCWTRIAVPDRRHRLIELESRGVKVVVGGYVSDEARAQVAQELRRALRKSALLR